MRSRFLLAAFPLLPVVLAGVVHGCGSGDKPIESICRWIAQDDNCYRVFRQDTVDDNGVSACATLGTPTLPSATNVTGDSNGNFLSRDALDVCFIGGGGQVVLDPPIDLKLLGLPPDPANPPKPQMIKIKDFKGAECGSFSFGSTFSFSVTINPPEGVDPDAGCGDAGSDAGDGGTCDIDKPFGTYSQTLTTGGNTTSTVDVVCPNNTGEHFFELQEINGQQGASACPQLAPFQPAAQFTIVPGGINQAGSVSFAITWPPSEEGIYPDFSTQTVQDQTPKDWTIDGSPVTVVYFNCAIPPAPEICINGVKDGTESDIDCGGVESKPGCPARCADGQACVNDCDCDVSAGLLCMVDMGTRKCKAGDGGTPPDCSSVLICANHQQDGTESDVDCGGAVCAKCDNGKKCNTASDCVSGYCLGNICSTPSCNDSAKNSGETDIDCGGPCAQEPFNQGCPDGDDCLINGDCSSGLCVGLKCLPANCMNDVKDGSETDKDCGGPGCPKCDNLKLCKKNSDCVSNACVPNPANGGALTCLFPSCSDMFADGDESDVDCGGSCSMTATIDGGTVVVSGGCDDGKLCGQPLDCTNQVCGAAASVVVNNTQTVFATKKCFPAACAGTCGGSCQLCDNGQACALNSDCVGKACIGGMCTTAGCGDTQLNGDESDVDCGGSCTQKCAASQKCNTDADCAAFGADSGPICINKICQQ